MINFLNSWQREIGRLLKTKYFRTLLAITCSAKKYRYILLYICNQKNEHAKKKPQTIALIIWLCPEDATNGNLVKTMDLHSYSTDNFCWFMALDKNVFKVSGMFAVGFMVSHWCTQLPHI